MAPGSVRPDDTLTMLLPRRARREEARTRVTVDHERPVSDSARRGRPPRDEPGGDGRALVVVPEDRLVPVPDGVDAGVAACSMEGHVERTFHDRHPARDHRRGAGSGQAGRAVTPAPPSPDTGTVSQPCRRRPAATAAGGAPS
ncbi:hypothetical protein GCM10025792_03580 [Pseudonocardia tropica]